MTATLPWADLAWLFGHFMLLSLMAMGGVLVVAPEVHRVMVTQSGLLTDPQFAAAIAIAQASPGPNFLYVSVCGYLVGGFVGALATTLGLLLPSTTLAFFAARFGEKHREHRAVRAFNIGMAPIVIALLAATAWILASHAPDWRSFVITAIAALLVWRTKVHLLWLIAGGGIAGALGWA